MEQYNIKQSLFFLISFSVLSVTAQDNQRVRNDQSTLLQAGQAQTSFGAAMQFYNPKRPVDGTDYLFDNWNNSCEIVSTDGKRFFVSNVNFNIRRNTFESRYAPDSLFVFNFNNIDKFIIEDRIFKNYFWNNNNRVYQIVFETEAFSIIKGFKVDEVAGSPNPMLNRMRDRLIRRAEYFKRTNRGTIERFKLNRKNVLNLVDTELHKKLFEYVDRNELSYKDEKDVEMMLAFIVKGI